jgi:hypothetical protein
LDKFEDFINNLYNIQEPGEETDEVEEINQPENPENDLKFYNPKKNLPTQISRGCFFSIFVCFGIIFSIVFTHLLIIKIGDYSKNYHPFTLPDNTSATYVVNNSLFAVTPDGLYCIYYPEPFSNTYQPIDFEIKKILLADYDLTKATPEKYSEFFIIDGENNLRRYNLETNTLGDVLYPNISDFYCVPNYSQDKWTYVALTTNGDLYLQGLVETRYKLPDPYAPSSYENEYYQDYYHYDEPIKLLEDVKNFKNSRNYKIIALTNSGEVYYWSYYDSDKNAMEIEKFEIPETIEVSEFYTTPYNNVILKTAKNEYYFWNNYYNKKQYEINKKFSDFKNIATTYETSLAIGKKGRVYFWGTDPLKRTMYSFWVIPSKSYHGASSDNPEKLPKLKGIDKILAGTGVFYAFDGNKVYVV